MNPHSPNSPEDRLLDELLQEQHHGPDELFIQQIEAAVDNACVSDTKRESGKKALRYAIAASVVLAAGAGALWRNHSVQQMAAQQEKRDYASAEQMALQLAIREQEARGGEIRKSLSSSVRTEGTNYAEATSHAGVDGDQTQIAHNDVSDETIQPSFVVPGSRVGQRRLESEQPGWKEVRFRQAAASASLGTPPAEEDLLADNRVQASMERPASPPSSTVTNVIARPPVDGPGQSFGQRFGDEPIGGGFLPNIRGNLVDKENAQPSGDRYGTFIDQPWKSPTSDPLSTFSIDVDTASYGNVRRMIREGREIPRDAVRIEECINAFDYRYQAPTGDGAFAVGAALAACPWAPGHQLVRIAIKGREIDKDKRPASNLVFLIDVSGSMQSPDKLPLLKQSMATLVQQLDERDRVAIVVYAGSEGVALPSTRLDTEGKAAVLASLSKLEAGGSTNGGAGIKRAYEMALQHKIDGAVNRVILATDGDFNVGVTGQESLVGLVKERAQKGIYLTVLGYGTGNLNDAMMDAITRDGNGNYFYIDSEREGRKVFLQNLSGTLVTIAKDVKIQVEFNPAKVGSYRLIGYANRVLRNEDFNNDKIDAGDIGAGHTVTAFYELTPPGAATDGLKYQATSGAPVESAEWLTVKLRHKHPDGDESRKIEFPLTGDALPIEQAGADFQFATAVALFGMKLRGMEDVGEIGWDRIATLARPGLADDKNEDRAEFLELVNKLGGVRERIIGPPPAELMPRDHNR